MTPEEVQSLAEARDVAHSRWLAALGKLRAECPHVVKDLAVLEMSNIPSPHASLKCKRCGATILVEK